MLQEKKALEQLLQEKISGGLRARTMVVQGNPAEEITRLAAIGNADIIVIATMV